MPNRDQQRTDPQPARKGGEPADTEQAGHVEQAGQVEKDWYNGGVSAPMTGPGRDRHSGHGESEAAEPNRFNDDPVYGDARPRAPKRGERAAKDTTGSPPGHGAEK